MPRFVLLRHQCPPDYEKPSHWDLMLEQGNSLATWELRELPASWARLLNLPQNATVETVATVRLPDHRLAYLEFEGPLSGNRGEVHPCDRGDYKLLTQQEEILVFRLFGATLTCEAKLSCLANDWQLEALSSLPN